MSNFKVACVGFVIGLVVAAIAALYCYNLGFDHGSANEKKMQQEAALIVQNNIKRDYEKRIQDLSASLELIRNEHAERLRELEEFSNTRTSLDSCRSDRSRLARLAVRGEKLLKRADSYFEAIKR